MFDRKLKQRPKNVIIFHNGLSIIMIMYYDESPFIDFPCLQQNIKHEAKIMCRQDSCTDEDGALIVFRAKFENFVPLLLIGCR